MMPVTDYQIYQRDGSGYAEVQVAGVLPEHVEEGRQVCTRVCREEDGMTVIPWTECAVTGRAWKLHLRLPQGGLYRIETSVGKPGDAYEWRERIQNICHVGVGELFMITGQSNMAGYGRDAAYDPPRLGVHLYGNNGKWSIATHPLNDSIDTIYPENRETCSGASPLLSFARQVQRSLNVPVGLVQASLGGSPLSAWNPEEDGTLYRAMLRRLDATGPVGAVLWYQGCSDANEQMAPTYLDRFTRMVARWREQLGEVPFVTVQLNRWANSERDEEADHFWGMVREAQRQAARRIPGVYVVPATDLPCTDGVHNSAGANVMLGERMANVYLKARFSLPGQVVPDVERVVRVDDTHLLVEMTPDAEVDIMSSLGDGFDAEDTEGVIACEKAEQVSEGILLTFERPFEGKVCFHMLWRAAPPAFVPRGRHGMPVLSCYGVKAE